MTIVFSFFFLKKQQNTFFFLTLLFCNSLSFPLDCKPYRIYLCAVHYLCAVWFVCWRWWWLLLVAVIIIIYVGFCHVTGAATAPIGALHCKCRASLHSKSSIVFVRQRILSSHLNLSPFPMQQQLRKSSSSWRQVEENWENWETKKIIMTANFHSNDARLLILILMYIIHASSSHLLEQTSFEIFLHSKKLFLRLVCVLFVHYWSWRRWLRHVHLSSSPLYFPGYLMWLLSRLLFINAEQQSLGI